MKKLITFIILFFFIISSFSQSAYWEKSLTKVNFENLVDQPTDFQQYNLKIKDIKSKLFNAPLRANNTNSNILIELPNEFGEIKKYQIFEASNLHPDLASRYPNIKSYVGKGIDNNAVIRLSYAPSQGINVIISNENRPTTLIKSINISENSYAVYSRNLMSDVSDFECETIETAKNSTSNNDMRSVDGFLRKYRVAISTTGEFSQFWLDGTETSDAERKGKVLAAVNTSLTRVNGIFERDFSVTMELVPNNDALIFLNPATDPYNISNSAIQNAIDTAIGSSNYDVGHLFGHEGSIYGNAGCIACVCTPGAKGQAYTVHSAPDSDHFNMIVSHEFGHQFGGYHVQSSSNCRSSAGLQEVEPGSGSTIMGYAGICPANVQSFPDDYFNYVDIRDTNQWTRFDSSCAQLIPSGNTEPTANAGNDYTIPKSTAFKLEGVGTDVDAGDNLSFCWEENDPENPFSSSAPSPTRTQGPMFRSKLPVGIPIRYIPQISDVIAGNLTPTWEVLPSVSRTMDIRFTVRDNAIFGPQTASDEMTVTVNASAGPFQVTSQSSSETWDVGTNVTVNWDVANTNQAPINTNSVTILLSVDGGFTYPHTLVANTSNDGSETFLLPNVPTSNQGRIMVKPTNNIYFAINSSNINIQASEFIMNFIETDVEVCQPNNAIYNFTYNTFLGFSETTTFAATNIPAGSNISFNPISATTDGTNVQVTVSNTQNVTVGSYDFDIVGTAPSVSRTSTVSLHVFDSNLVIPTLQFPTNGETSIDPNVNLIWNTDLNASSYAIEIAQDAGFTTIIETGNSITNQYQATNLDFDTEYFWRVKMNNECGSSDFSSVFSFVTFCVAPTNVNVSNVLIDNALVNWTENGNATSWEIEVVETGNSPTGIGVSAPTNPFTITGLNSSTDYIAYVRSSCGSGNFSDWTLSSIFTTGADFCSGDNFYDSGGAGGNYSNGENIITTIAPSTGFNVVTVQFNSFNTEGGYDYLRIYDGPNTSSPQLGIFDGSTNPGSFTSTHGTGALTFWFTSDGSVISSGWDASVICSSISCPNPFDFEVNNILGDSVELNWMAGDTETNWQIEYGLNGFTQGTGTIVPTTTNSHSLTGLNPATNYEVYLRANCGANPGDDDSAWLGPIAFMTLCDVLNAPWIDNVETHQGTTSSNIENCWSSSPNNTTNAYRWDLSEFGSTPSFDTGPNSGNSGSKYFYTESSGYNTGDIAELYTPLINLSTMSIPQLSFYYHMYGANMGSLHVDIFNNGTWFDDEIVITGQQHTSGSDDWTEQLLLLTAYTGEIQIRFRGIRGTGYESDMSIDDIQVFEAPTCPDPTDLVALNNTDTTIDLSWTNGNTESAWEIEYGSTGFTQGNGTIVQASSNPYTLTGLSFNSNYDVYLRANCGANPGDDDSSWFGPVNVNTNCNFNTPWFDNIENYPVGTLHQCQWTSWDNFPGGGDDFKVTDNIAFSGTKSLYIPNDNVTDGVLDLGNKTSGHWTLKFKMYIPSNSTGYFNLQGQVPINGGEWLVGNIHFNEANNNSGVGHIDNSFNGDISFNFPHNQWFNIEMNFDLTSGISSATWEFKVDGNIVINEFTPFTDNSGTIPTSLGGVNFFSIDNDNFVYLDDFEYRAYNIGCPSPSNFNATNVTTTSVDLNWINGGTETNWEIEYGLDGFSQGNGTIVSTATNSYNLTSLNSDTNYDVYLRANCGANPGDDDSSWIGPISFTTLISCPAPSNLNITNITFDTAELNWINGGTETNWEIEYGLDGFSQGNGTIVQATTNPYTLTGLSVASNYDVYLRANCGLNPGDDDSSWIGPISFTTLCSDFGVPFIEEFESFNTPNCWTESGSESWNFNTNPDYQAASAGDHTDGGGTNFAWIDGSTPNGVGQISNLRTPVIDVSSLTQPTVQYAVYSYNTDDNTYNTLNVIIHQSNGVSSTIQTLQASTNGWQVFTFDLSTVITENLIQIEFSIEENSPGDSFFNDILIDDVKVDEYNNLTVSQDDFTLFNFNYYPNPVTNELILSANEQISSINVYTLLGQEIIRLKPNNSSLINVDMSLLSSGTYFVKVQIDSKTKVLKIIKK